MSPAFQAVVEQLHERLECLLAADPYKSGMILPKKGVYLFSESVKALYVGRSNDIPARYRNHRNGKAAFAYASRPRKAGIQTHLCAGSQGAGGRPSIS